MESALGLLCFKIVDLINVIELENLDIDNVGKEMGTNHTHKGWLHNFVKTFDSLYRVEHRFTSSRLKFSKVLEPLCKMLVEKELGPRESDDGNDAKRIRHKPRIRNGSVSKSRQLNLNSIVESDHEGAAD